MLPEKPKLSTFSAVLQSPMTATSFEPNFHEVFRLPLGRPPRGRSFSAEQADVLARKRLTDFLAGRRRCCRGRCARGFLEDQENLEKCLRWRRAWHLVPHRSQNISILSYVRANSSTSASSSKSSASFCTKQPGSMQLAIADQTQNLDHPDPDCEQHYSLQDDFQDIDDCTRRTMKTAYGFLGVSLCRRSWLLLTGISSRVLVRARMQTGRGQTDWAHAGYNNRLRPQMTAMAALLWSIVQNLRETLPLKDIPFDHIVMPFHEKVFLFRMVQDEHYHNNLFI